MPRRPDLRRVLWRGVLVAGAVAVLGGWMARPRGHCADGDSACLSAAVRAHPAGRQAFWREAMQQPLARRVGPAPEPLVAQLTLDNRLHGYPQRPRASVLEPAFLRDVEQAMADIPPRVWQLVAPQLAGIYFVDDLGGSGFTSAVTDAQGRHAGAYVVLDARVLAGVTGNGWATWKENTPFLWNGMDRLQAVIATPEEDGRVAAIRYILLHELGHVASVGRNLHPRWDAPAPASLERYAFARESWTVHSPTRQYRPNAGSAFVQRERLTYYVGAQLRADERAATYRALEGTAFATLYAATNPGDDFAESFASYVHVVLMHKPWRVTITQAGEVVATYRACWGEPRCAGKQALLEGLLGPKPR